MGSWSTTLVGANPDPGLSHPPGGGAEPSLAGQVIGGRYTVLDLLGKGGVGAVYRASDQILGEDVAIKFLQASTHRDPRELERFKRELQTARKISHPNVLRIHDIGMQGGEFFISMEILAGGTLAGRIAAGVIPIDEAVRISLGICDGLQAAHAEGIVHRDLKPDNVLFDSQDRPKLVDFGLARLANSSTRTVGFSGTPYYMSPEQADGADATVRSDVYSLGVLLFEVFTGRLPFIADSLVRLVVLHTKEAPPSPRSIRRDLPPAIDALLMRCLEKDPARRFASAGDVAKSLRALGSSSEATVIGAAPVDDDDTPVPLPEPAPRVSRARVGAGVGALALVVVGLGLAASGVFGGAGVASPTPTPLALAPTPTPTVVAVSPVQSATAATPVRTRVAVATKTPIPTATRTAAPAESPVVIAAAAGMLDVVGAYVHVTLDGKDLPEPPFRSFKLPAGKHELRFRGGKLDKTELVDVRSGAKLRFEIMKLSSGDLTVIRRQ